MRHRHPLAALAAIALTLCGALAGPARAADPAAPAAAAAAPAPAVAAPFGVYPDSVNLNTSRDAQSLVVQVVRPDGVTLDVTAQATFAVSDPKLAKIDGHVVRPLADGAGSVAVTYEGKTVNVPLAIKDAATDRPVSFKLDVMPTFLKAGCNSGSCHGAARGKDGFRLSLFGYDPDGDYQRITREIATRRVNLAVPSDSLMVAKAVGAVPHTGGVRYAPESEMNQAVVRWLTAGAPQDAAAVATPVSLEILPRQAVLEGEGAQQQMTVRAKYSDGTDRDVTSLALFMSNNDNSAKIGDDGRVVAGKRGEAFVMARFATFTVGSQVIVIPKGLQYQWPAGTPENNYVDALINAKLKKLRVTPSDVCGDEVFLRRVFVDVVGKLPTPEEHAKFLADADPKKREKLVDELLGRKEFVELWVMKFAELLQVRTIQNRVSYKSALLYYNWLSDRLSRNVPMDKIVQELLGASGGTFATPATNYYQTTDDKLLLAENTAQVFMGMRLQCAQCHNHPFDRWTQDEYYQFTAFFTQVGRKDAEDPREKIVFNSGGGESKHPVTNQDMKPKFLGGAEPDVAGKDRRVVLAQWLASKENPYFAKNLANVVWSHFFGRGIIEPVDDVRISNPAVNPELLEALGGRFQEYNYDFRRLVRDICTSRTYQLSTRPNETNAEDSTNFSHAALRRIRAEVMLDVISQATDTKDKFKGLPLGSRAVQIADGETSSFFLTVFGRATRETVCSCEVKMEPNLGQALHLINGDTLSRKLQQSALIREMIKDKATPEQVIDTLYLRTFSRKPTDAERAQLVAAVPPMPTDPKADKGKVAKARQQVYEDIFWALMNSQEFMFNH